MSLSQSYALQKSSIFVTSEKKEMLQLSYNRNIFDKRQIVDPVTSNRKYHGDEKWVCRQDYYHLFLVPISLQFLSLEIDCRL